MSHSDKSSIIVKLSSCVAIPTIPRKIPALADNSPDHRVQKTERLENRWRARAGDCHARTSSTTGETSQNQSRRTLRKEFGLPCSSLGDAAMAENVLVRARIDERTKKEAAACAEENRAYRVRRLSPAAFPCCRGKSLAVRAAQSECRNRCRHESRAPGRSGQGGQAR